MGANGALGSNFQKNQRVSCFLHNEQVASISRTHLRIVLTLLQHGLYMNI